MKCLLSGALLLLTVAAWGCNGPEVEAPPQNDPVSPQPGFDELPATPQQSFDEQPGPTGGFDGATDPQSTLQDAPPAPTLDAGLLGDEDTPGKESLVPEGEPPAIPEFSLQGEDESDAE
jgi:hypothetical protein